MHGRGELGVDIVAPHLAPARGRGAKMTVLGDSCDFQGFDSWFKQDGDHDPLSGDPLTAMCELDDSGIGLSLGMRTCAI